MPRLYENLSLGFCYLLSEMEAYTVILKVVPSLKSPACRKLMGNSTLINHNSHWNNRAILCVALLKSFGLVSDSTEAELYPSLFLKCSHANVLCNQQNLLTNKESNLRNSVQASQLSANKHQKCKTNKQWCEVAQNCRTWVTQEQNHKSKEDVLCRRMLGWENVLHLLVKSPDRISVSAHPCTFSLELQ